MTSHPGMIKASFRCAVRFSTRSSALMTLATGCDGASRAASDIPLVATTEEVFTLGGAEVPDWQAFVEVSEVQFDGAGNLILVDRRQPRIAVADSEGEFRHFVSRVGDGPGELRSVTGVEVLRDNRLVVSDAGHAALLLFGMNGEFVDQFSVDNRSRMTPLPGETTQLVMVSSSRLPIFLGTLPDGVRRSPTSFASRTPSAPLA